MLLKSICYLRTSFISQILIFGLHEAKSVLSNNQYRTAATFFFFFTDMKTNLQL